MRKALTAKTLEAVTNNGPKRLEIFDALLPGFGVRVSTNGHKSFFCVVRHLGRLRRFTIGPYPRISLSDAREVARNLMSQADRNLPVEPSANAQKLRDIIPQFIELYARPKNRGWQGAERLLMRNFKPLLEMPLGEIKRTHVVRVLDDIMARGRPGTANHSLATIKKLMNWALDRGTIEINPITGLAPPGKKLSRDRVLNDDEVQQLMTAALAEGYPFGSLYLILLYTGQRRGEASGMRWSELSLQRRIWTIPSQRSKNGRAHEVPLSDPISQILTSVPRFLGSDFVFTTTGTTPISGFGRAKDRVELALGCSDWRVHDLRRTAASGMARLGVAPHVIEAVLNHRSGQISGVAAVYNRYRYQAEMREALSLWAEHLTRLQVCPTPNFGAEFASFTKNTGAHA